jgi:hypothetical protein
LVAAGVALATAVAVFLITPSTETSTKVLQAAIGVGVVSALWGIGAIWRRYNVHPLRWFARLSVRFVVLGLMEWAKLTKDSVDGDSVWDWLTDQVFVIQRRYAFSVGCIAFGDHEERRYCLMVERPFRNFPEPVYLWPGGRVRGTEKDFKSEVEGLVRQETGCDVTLLAVGQPGGAFSTDVTTYHPPGDTTAEANSLLQPPVLVMQQNRTQSHDVPGHIDLLYVASGDPSQDTKGQGRWVALEDLRMKDQQKYWPDTKTCVERAAQVYARAMEAKP